MPSAVIGLSEIAVAPRLNMRYPWRAPDWLGSI